MRQKVFKYLLFVLFLVVFIVTQVSGRMEVTKKKRKSTMVGFEQRGACGCCEKDGVKSMNKAVSILNPFNSRTNVFEAAKSKSYLYAEPVCKGKVLLRVIMRNVCSERKRKRICAGRVISI